MRRFFIHDLDDSLAETTANLRGDIGRIPDLTLVEGAREFLSKYKEDSYLVTAGKLEEQRQKIDVLGIRHCFRRIFVVPKSEDKKEKIRELVHSFPVERPRIFIIGDRLDVEICTGNELGCTTFRVQLPGGRHSTMVPRAELHEVPDHTVRDFREILRLLSK